MFRAFSKFIFWLIGWKVAGHPVDKNIPKSIYVAIPHTSNWDFPLGVMARSIIGIKITYIMKATMFRPPFGWFLTASHHPPMATSMETGQVAPRDGIASISPQDS